MTRLSLLLALLLLPAGEASAARRTIGVGSFDRLRVEGPFVVQATSGGSPGATVEGEESALDRVEVRLDGTTLVVRAATGGWGERPVAARAGPATVTLSTPDLVGVGVLGAGKVAVDGRLRGARVTLSVGGGGALSVAGVDADQAEVTLVGGGAITVAGRAARVRLLANGPGTIDAGALQADDLVAHLDGLGEIKGAARYTARVSNAGLGRVTIAGRPKCQVAAGAGGTVESGDT